MTTSLVCPLVQGATAHKPRRCAATHIHMSMISYWKFFANSSPYWKVNISIQSWLMVNLNLQLLKKVWFYSRKKSNGKVYKKYEKNREGRLSVPQPKLLHDSSDENDYFVSCIEICKIVAVLGVKIEKKVKKKTSFPDDLCWNHKQIEIQKNHRKLESLLVKLLENC